MSDGLIALAAQIRTDLHKTLHPGRPFGIHYAGLEFGLFYLEPALRAEGCDRKTGIVKLMASKKFRCRKIHQPALVLIH